MRAIATFVDVLAGRRDAATLDPVDTSSLPSAIAVDRYLEKTGERPDVAAAAARWTSTAATAHRRRTRGFCCMASG